MTFNESNMRFQYDDENIYRIEDADIITKIEGCKACEFIALKDDKILVVEAKSSSPEPQSKEDFDQYIADITQKFSDTILLYGAIRMGRHGEISLNDIPQNVREVDVSHIDYCLYLIVHGNQLDWMQPIQDALKQSLRHLLRLWNIPERNVKAINEKSALDKGLIAEVL